MRRLMLALLGLVLAGSPALTPAQARTPGDPPAAQRAPAARVAPASRAARPTAPAAARPAMQQARLPARGGRAGQRRPVVQRAEPIRGQLAVSRDWRTASASTGFASPDAAGSGCGRSRGIARCGGQMMSWTQGLPPAAGVQANACPAGTMATLAQGHDDIVRCMPL
ncbi:hypothetical protein [Siccirubricoccus sp. G192]|uniref:hypothetical protein n=1 Tax=Siccirubricoccus sp. G192 TaxID=2849651 RepID=UPI001C2BC1CB|nr:hypothetical protein [Siccirubricoccus sp. G192]MBV1796979.1 hypothetical protein [Siccirubricoccus sp. G192]